MAKCYETDVIQKDVMTDIMNLDTYRNQGVVAKCLQCDHCRLEFVGRWDRQMVHMFKCGHNFHNRCIEGNNCRICFNEYEHIQNII